MTVFPHQLLSLILERSQQLRLDPPDGIVTEETDQRAAGSAVMDRCRGWGGSTAHFCRRLKPRPGSIQSKIDTIAVVKLEPHERSQWPGELCEVS